MNSNLDWLIYIYLQLIHLLKLHLCSILLHIQWNSIWIWESSAVSTSKIRSQPEFLTLHLISGFQSDTRTHTCMHARACARPFPGKYRPHLPVLLSIIYIIMIEYWLEKKTSKKRPEGWDWWADFLSRFLSAGCLPKAGIRIYLTQLTMTWGWMVLLQIPWALILKVCNVLQ